MPKRSVSTPGVPSTTEMGYQQQQPGGGSNLGHITFNSNITAFGADNNTTAFTYQQDSNLNLSTIPECSHESDRSRNDSEKSGDGDNASVSIKNPALSFDPFNKTTRSKCVDVVSQDITSTPGFLRINGPIQHLNGGKDICLG